MPASVSILNLLAISGTTLWLASMPCSARQATTQLGVGITITGPVEQCGVVSSPMVFGPGQGVVMTGRASIATECPPAMPYQVSLSAGSLPGSSVNNRRMPSLGSPDVAYGLYMDPSLSRVWGEGEESVHATADGSVQPLTVYGKVAGNGVAPGSFADVVAVLVAY
jgi:spore coat protein U-like protein